MPQRPTVIDELQDILSNWIAELNGMRPLGAYLFGSTVNEGGVRFQPDEGDLDVIMVMDWEVMSPGDRVAQINALRHAKGQLEALLFQKLHRESGSKQIVSLVPVTQFEVDHAVHKDNLSHILTGAAAYDLVRRLEIPNLSGGRSSQPLTDFHRSVAGFVQKKRAEAVSITPNGKGGLSVEPHDDPVPKPLMRNFAAATYDPTKDADPSDLNRGLREIGRFADQAADWTPMTSAFASWLEVRRGARGEVSPVISADHYLLVLETIFDRVRSGYPSVSTVRYVAPVAGYATPPATPRLSPDHKLKAEFRVTQSDKLGGSKDQVLRMIRSARANMWAGIPQPFNLVFDEVEDAEALLATDDAKLSTQAHRRRIKAFERRTLVAARQERWTQGIELILWFGGTLFNGGEEVVEEACRVAMSNWFGVAATNVVNPGGIFEAAHNEFYRSHGLALSFPAKASVDDALAGLQSLRTLKPRNLAEGFVPNLISKYLHLIAQPEWADLKEKADRVFDITEWRYGLK